MKKTIASVWMLFMVSVLCHFTASAQIKYQSNILTVGNTNQFSYYMVTIAGNGVYFNHSNGRFLQISVAATGAPRLAGHNDQIVFYNSQTKKFNDIQVKSVLNYSDARAKTNVQSLNNGLKIINRLNPVTYNFNESQASSYVWTSTVNQYTGNNTEIGLLAQEVESVLPNLVFTDDEGRKLVNYTALIPVLIDAVKALQKEVEDLKAKL